MSDIQKLYQRGYRAALLGTSSEYNPYRGAQGVAWLNGHYDALCAIARSNNQPMPETPFKGKVEISP